MDSTVTPGTGEVVYTGYEPNTPNTRGNVGVFIKIETIVTTHVVSV